MKLYETAKDDISLLVLEITEEYLQKRIMSNVCVKTNKYNIKDLFTDEGYGFNQEGEPTILIDELTLDGEFGDLKVNFSDEVLEKYKELDAVILICTGPKYQDLVKSITELPPTKEIPATFIYDLKEAIIIVDEMAARKLPKEE